MIELFSQLWQQSIAGTMIVGLIFAFENIFCMAAYLAFVAAILNFRDAYLTKDEEVDEACTLTGGFCLVISLVISIIILLCNSQVFPGQLQKIIGHEPSEFMLSYWPFFTGLLSYLGIFSGYGIYLLIKEPTLGATKKFSQTISQSRWPVFFRRVWNRVRSSKDALATIRTQVLNFQAHEYGDIRKKLNEIELDAQRLEFKKRDLDNTLAELNEQETKDGMLADEIREVSDLIAQINEAIAYTWERHRESQAVFDEFGERLKQMKKLLPVCELKIATQKKLGKDKKQLQAIWQEIQEKFGEVAAGLETAYKRFTEVEDQFLLKKPISVERFLADCDARTVSDNELNNKIIHLQKRQTG